MLPSLFLETTPAILVLADGTVFQGYSVGASGHTVGEVVFNTSMSGYQEILSDPSYHQQLVTFTYPHIGNTGVNKEDVESSHHQASGMIIRDYPNVVSNFRATDTLKNYLNQRGIVAIAGVDTRKLTRLLREKGTQPGCILVGDDVERALQLARDFKGLAGLDLAKEVSTKQVYEWTQGTWCLEQGFTAPDTSKFHVVAYDYGVKQNILRLIADRGCRVTVVPAQTPVAEVLALNPDGVFLSNGPGDPEPCDYAIEAVKTLINKQVPLFGICLGHQILGLAVGGKTRKMKFGHHGANHPVQDLETKRVYITTQNHGFEVDASSLPETVKVTHVSLFDGSLQGIELLNAPAFSFQGHPEASSGPQDIVALFDKFAELMQRQKRA